MALTRGGSERAFAEIMRRYQRPLQFYCVHMVGAPRAEDAVQQAFMQAFVALRDGERREIALRPWLYRITRNCAIDLLRKQPYEHDELDPDFDSMAQPPGVLEQKEELARVVAAIQALPERQRRAITLRELEGRSYGEISAELGHTDSGVRQLIFRARTALRNLGAFILPVGSTRWRLLGSPSSSAADPHHIAAAATVSSGGGANVFQAAASAVVATLALIGAPAPGHHGGAGSEQAGVQAAGPSSSHSSATGGASGDVGQRAHETKRGADPSRGPNGGAGAPALIPLSASDATPPATLSPPVEPVTATEAGDQPTDRAAPEAGGGEPEKLEASDASPGAENGSTKGGDASEHGADPASTPATEPAPAPQPEGTTGPTGVKKPKAAALPKVNPPKGLTTKKPNPPWPPVVRTSAGA